MPLRPDALDYEELFPTNRRTAREGESFVNPSVSTRPGKGWDASGPALFGNSSSHADSANGSPPRVNAATPQKGPTDSIYLLRRNGHTVTFAGLFLFSIILYIRPYEFFPGLSSFTSMAFYSGIITLTIYAATQLSLEGNLTARPKEINLVLLLTVAALLSMPLADDIGGAWKTFSEHLIKAIVIFVVLVNTVRTELRLKLLLLLVLGVSIYLSVNAINDYRLGLFGTGTVGMADARIVGRIRGLFENSNDLALHLVTMIPIAVVLGMGKRDPFRKLIYLGTAALMVGAVVVTFSRGGFLGLVAAGFILVRRLGRKNRTATTAALVFAVILFLALAPGAYSGRLSSIVNSSADLTGSSSQRNEVLKRSIWVALRYPLFGVGIGNFRQKSPRNLETHNAYTQVASEMGLAAMVIYIMFLVHPLRRLRLIENTSYSKPDQTKFFYLSVGLQASLVGFMVSSFFGAVAYQWYVYYLVAYAVSLHRLYIVKFPPEDGLERSLWEHPFAKKRTPFAGTESTP
jgi:O-antigen ligase